MGQGLNFKSGTSSFELSSPMLGREELYVRALRGELERVESEAAHLRAMIRELERFGRSELDTRTFAAMGDLSAHKRMRFDVSEGIKNDENLHIALPQPVKPTPAYLPPGLTEPLKVIHEPTNPMKLEKPSPTCEKCGRTFTTQKDLRRHNATKHEGIRYPCDKCGRSFARPYQLRHHVEEKHGEEGQSALEAGVEHNASLNEAQN